jgi:Zn finger protein HypA/HybF involved in hydrogenase expression
MHEMWIAETIMQVAHRQVPAGSKIRKVKVRAGAKRAIDPKALQVAWDVWTAGVASAAVKLELNTRPWRYHCPKCHHDWTSHDAEAVCSCGYDRPTPTGSDELKVTSIEIEDDKQAVQRCVRGVTKWAP